MSRPLRILFPDAWYHVMNHARRRESLFRDDQDFIDFISLLKKSIELWSIRVAGYCLMSNHYHLLLQTPDANLPRCMRHIDGVYTQRFNRKYGHDGTLFRGRYKSILVDAEGYLLEVLRYIHRNPMKAGIEDRLGEYKWTSHSGYLSRAKKWSWLHKQDLLSRLEGDPEHQRKAYIDFMSEVDSEGVSDFYSKKNLRPVLGSSEFLQWIKDGFADALFHEEVPAARSLRCKVDEVVAAVSLVFDVEPGAVLTRMRGRSNEARDVAILLARKWTGHSLSRLAAHFGLKRHGSVTTALARASLIRERAASKARIVKAEALIKIRQQST